MYAYELLPKLQLLTLTVNESEHWDERIAFIGSEEQWDEVERLSEILSQ